MAELQHTNCSVDGCSNRARSGRSRYCETHYYRLRRNGSLILKPPRLATPKRKHTAGYVRVHAPKHPLTLRHTGIYEYEHRVVFYDAHGEGPFWCHWCACAVTWSDMHVDHLNDVKDDNRVENLVASCAECNQKRGLWKMARKKRASGVLITANGLTLCVSEWARRIGIAPESLTYRLRSGWSAERAVTAPRGRFGPERQETARQHGKHQP